MRHTCSNSWQYIKSGIKQFISSRLVCEIFVGVVAANSNTDEVAIDRDLRNLAKEALLVPLELFEDRVLECRLVECVIVHFRWISSHGLQLLDNTSDEVLAVVCLNRVVAATPLPSIFVGLPNQIANTITILDIESDVFVHKISELVVLDLSESKTVILPVVDFVWPVVLPVVLVSAKLDQNAEIFTIEMNIDTRMIEDGRSENPMIESAKHT